MKVRFIGDIHGQFSAYQYLVCDAEASIQVGDYGIGFGPHPDMPGKDKFIRGNHDHPELCKSVPNYIHDGSFVAEANMFLMGGALSVDREYREEGVNWWSAEEMEETELLGMVARYTELKPDVVVTHDCPESIVAPLFPWYLREYPSRTRMALEMMLQAHRPKLWIFGHWHNTQDRMIDGTRFVCLGPMVCMDVELPYRESYEA